MVRVQFSTPSSDCNPAGGGLATGLDHRNAPPGPTIESGRSNFYCTDSPGVQLWGSSPKESFPHSHSDELYLAWVEDDITADEQRTTPRRPRQSGTRLPSAMPARGADHSAPFVCGFLLLAVGLVFVQTVRHEFVNCDDNQYVYQNPHLALGWTPAGMAWAMSERAVYWGPLTWLSLMLDQQVYGPSAGGYHVTNLLLHAVAAVLLFLVLRADRPNVAQRDGGGAVRGPSAAGGVRAWVTERKDVLSGVFFMATLGAYLWYVRRPFSLGRYLLLAAVFTLGLTAKLMLITLPLVLLLLDYWPLGRISRGSWKRLVMEKLPLLAPVVVGCAITLVARAHRWPRRRLSLGGGGSARSCLLRRLYRAVLLCGRPGGSASAFARVARLAGFRGASASAWRDGGRLGRPAATALSARRMALVPGHAAAGERRRAVRRSGGGRSLYVFAADRARHRAGLGRGRRVPRLAPDSAAVCRGVGRNAGGLDGNRLAADEFLRDNETLWTHTLLCTARNGAAHYHLAEVLLSRGQLEEAANHYQAALQITPGHFEAHNNLGVIFSRQRRFDEAAAHYRQALKIKPASAEAHVNLGTCLDAQGRLDEAAEQYRQALRIDPDYAEAYNNLGALRGRQGKYGEAIELFERALAIKPEFADAANLGRARAGRRRVEAAGSHAP